MTRVVGISRISNGMQCLRDMEPGPMVHEGAPIHGVPNPMKDISNLLAAFDQMEIVSGRKMEEIVVDSEVQKTVQDARADKAMIDAHAERRDCLLGFAESVTAMARWDNIFGADALPIQNVEARLANPDFRVSHNDTIGRSESPPVTHTTNASERDAYAPEPEEVQELERELETYIEEDGEEQAEDTEEQAELKVFADHATQVMESTRKRRPTLAPGQSLPLGERMLHDQVDHSAEAHDDAVVREVLQSDFASFDCSRGQSVLTALHQSWNLHGAELFGYTSKREAIPMKLKQCIKATFVVSRL
jgi:hypothetical protein